MVWKFAKIINASSDVKKEERAQCELCKKTFSYSGSNTTNIGGHLAKKHPAEWNQLLQKEKQKQPSISEYQVVKYGPDSSKHTEITEKVATTITKCFLPIGIVYSLNFKALINSLNPKYEIPGVEHFKKLILQQYQEKKVCYLYFNCNQYNNEVLDRVKRELKIYVVPYFNYRWMDMF